MLGFSTVAGGIGSAAMGGNFWQGAVNGLMVGALNHAKHQTENAKDRSQLNKVIEKYNKIVAETNDLAGVGIELAKQLSPSELRLLQRAGFVNWGIGATITGAYGYQAYDNHKTGRPWVENAIDAGISGIGLIPSGGQVAASIISGYKEAGNYFIRLVNWVNTRGADIVKGHIMMGF